MGLLVSGQNPAAIKTAERNIFTATAGQTSFTITQGYQPGDIDVYLNGIRLVDTEDYIALNGSTVVLNEAATVGDSVVVVCFYPFSVTSHYTKSESDTRYVNAGGDTMSGALALPSGGLTVGTDQLIVDSSGRVRTPYQPAFQSFDLSNTSLIGAGIKTFTTITLNRGNHFNGTRFTAPVSGSYLFSTFVQLWNSASGVVSGVRFYVNGSTINAGNIEMVSNGNGAHVNVSGSQILQLNVGDYVEVHVSNTHRGLQSGFSGFLIG